MPFNIMTAIQTRIVMQNALQYSHTFNKWKI